MALTASPLGDLPVLTAEEVHMVLLDASRIEGCARYKFIRGLLSLEESKLYLELGSPSIGEYAERHFGRQRTWTFEALRIARALDDLPRLTEAFLEGEISYSVVQEITRVATKFEFR